MSEKGSKYIKDKDATIQVRVNRAKKSLYTTLVADVSKDINEHIDNTIRKHGKK